MQRIKLSQAAPGMVAARPIEAPNGQVLCAKGTVMSEAIIARLQRLEISHVTVEGHPVDDGKADRTLEGDLAELDRRFQHAMDNKMMAALKVVIQKHIKKRYARMTGDDAMARDARPAPQAERAAEGSPPTS